MNPPPKLPALKALLATLLTTALSHAHAQQASLAPSEALRCMTPAGEDRAPPYPPQAFRARLGGRVAVEMTFTQADRAPRVRVLNTPEAVLVLTQAVEAHLSGFRVPCLPEGQSVTVNQEFNFVPDDGRQVVQWTQAREPEAERRKEELKCLVRPSQKMSYPLNARRVNAQGVVPLRGRFHRADGPPTITLLDSTPHSALVSAAQDYMAQLRLPCLQGEPLDVDFFFMFILEDAPRWAIQDMDLSQYLTLVKGIQEAQAYFDFGAMKCPFDLRVEMRQPAADNRVGELDGPVPERAFFIDWLSRQRLDLPAARQNALMTQRTTLRVPCGVLALGARTGGGGSR
ncbi:MAG: hypothetical protein JNJ71_11375 [Rubrivivax sp.]|nr:hypothetical protein [Rubrivivax sp.]